MSHFFFVLDMGDDVTRDSSFLHPVSYADIDGDYTCATEALDPANGLYGWYLALRPNEKVMWESPVIDGYIIFPTFDPTPDVVPTHNAPDQCGSEPPPDGEEGGELPDVVCTTSGVGRNYKLWFQCGLGDYTEKEDPASGVEVDTHGNTTTAYIGDSGGGDNEEYEEKHDDAHIVTNWRQF